LNCDKNSPLRIYTLWFVLAAESSPVSENDSGFLNPLWPKQINRVEGRSNKTTLLSKSIIIGTDKPQ